MNWVSWRVISARDEAGRLLTEFGRKRGEGGGGTRVKLLKKSSHTFSFTCEPSSLATRKRPLEPMNNFIQKMNRLLTWAGILAKCRNKGTRT